MKYLLYFFLVIEISSCTSSENKNYSKELHDSLLNAYSKFLNSISYVDTTWECRILLALNSNDTLSLKQEIWDLQELSKEYQFVDEIDTFSNQIGFKDIVSDEAYRFEYTKENCPIVTHFMIYRVDSVIKLFSLLYQKAEDPLKRKIIRQQTDSLSYEAWINFSSIMSRNDFWGLNTFNGHHGDGELKIWGIKKKLIRGNDFTDYKFIFRYDVKKLSITEAYIFLSTISKTKNDCF